VWTHGPEPVCGSSPPPTNRHDGGFGR
jgi:hypothetical protein